MLSDVEYGWGVLAFMAVGYLVGSVPFGLVVSRGLGTPDPRTAGSRNVGFTNVLRVGGRAAGFLTLFGDMGKGWVIGWGAAQVLHQEATVLIVALTPILGHLFSIFLGFHGGKGVATALGVISGIAPSVGLTMMAIWLVTVAIWRYSSGGALAAFSIGPIVAWALGCTSLFIIFTCAIGGLIWWKHAGNVARLWSGTEPRIGRAAS
jgi:glycerol-3-phosphate acyltransferase PlsY